jgi:hypothetical protein
MACHRLSNTSSINRSFKKKKKQCIIKFAITYKYVDEVICDVLSLDRKEIFYREQNQYHLNKEGTEYGVHAHHIKENQSLLTMEQLKKATYARNTPISVPSKLVDLKHEIEMVVEWKFNHTFFKIS